MQKTKSRIKVGLLKSCSATRAGYRCVLYQKSISLEAFLCLLHSMLIMWMEAFSCVKCRRSSRSVSFLLFHSHIRTLSCDFGFYSATDATWTCRQVQYLQLNECERMTEREHAPVITYCMFQWIHFSPSQHCVLFHDAFTLEPLLCESHLSVADLKIHTSISRRWASFSITTVWLQWYCDDKEKHCNKLPDWDNIMTPLHLSAKETPYNSTTHPPTPPI